MIDEFADDSSGKRAVDYEVVQMTLVLVIAGDDRFILIPQGEKARSGSP